MKRFTDSGIITKMFVGINPKKNCTRNGFVIVTSFTAIRFLRDQSPL